MRWSLCIVAAFVTGSAFADNNTIGPNGVDSAVTGLTGAGVLVGQGDIGRSGKFGYDSPAKSAMGTVPTGVYFRTSGGQDLADSSHVAEHATLVAGIMVGQSSVAPAASLHSAAFGEDADDVDTALTLNRLATLSSGTVRAIDLSFYRALGFFEEGDGSSHLTSFVDWSARQHDVLYAAAWGNNVDDFPATPVDNLNGITVAASEQRPGENSWRKFAAINQTEDLGAGLTSNVDILAPGANVAAFGFNSMAAAVNGTSAATPHVTGAAALLHQYSNQNFNTANSRRHEVMKAVMMNSADKMSGVQGANRTVLDSNDMDWEHSEAYLNPTIPLDDEMGAGHLNVRRAVQQYAAGEQSPGNVSLLGWDYGSYSGVGQEAVYTLNGSVPADQYITVTLIWDRDIESTGGSTYSSGDTFFGSGVADLNLAIERTNGTTLRTSIADDTNYEHIFYKTGGAEDIRIIVSQLGFATGNYAIAWWAGSGSSPTLPGDFNKNGSVGPEDYDVWKTNFGTAFADADGNEDGIVDAADYTIWRDNLGAGSGSLAAVPEPSAVLLLIVGLVATIRCRAAHF